MDDKGNTIAAKSSTRLFHRSLHNESPKAVRAEGNYIFAKDDRKLLDACSGAAVSIIGHGNQRVIAGIIDQMQTLDYVFSGTFSNQVIESIKFSCCNYNYF